MGCRSCDEFSTCVAPGSTHYKHRPNREEPLPQSKSPGFTAYAILPPCSCESFW
jgi:hypothetical protein